MDTLTSPPVLPASKLTKSQVKTFRKEYRENGLPCVIKAEVRHDDQCGNGHNSFAITATIYENGRDVCGGCCHEEVAKHFPELAPFIKWHLTSTDGPMHYLANTVYHASDKDYNGKSKGERYHIKGREEKRVVFGDFPISFEFEDDFIKFIESVASWQNAEALPVEHPPEAKSNYKFGPKWTIKGYTCEWYKCPFDREEEAKDFIKACQMFAPRIVIFQDKYTKVGEGKERDLNAARHCAVWPEATDEELTAPDLEQKLIARLPALMRAFKADVEKLGLVY
jgi:hypothetical protein